MSIVSQRALIREMDVQELEAYISHLQQTNPALLPATDDYDYALRQLAYLNGKTVLPQGENDHP